MKFTALALAISTALAAKDLDHRVKHESTNSPANWVKHDSVPASSNFVELAIMLSIPQEKFNHLENELLTRSSPNHSNYGNWLSNDEVHEIVAPNTESVDAISEFMQLHYPHRPLHRKTPNSDTFTITLTYEEAEELLDAK